MWCTRWFLPLLLLPLPTASPYFLFLFFFSLTLHARPCFYCIILLTALFTSSCYWQPVPTRTLLEATFPNTTFDAPLWYQPNTSFTDEGSVSPVPLKPLPSLIRLVDRCWCDFSGGHLFDPYNITLWQLSSLSRALGATEEPVLIAQKMDAASLIKDEVDANKMAKAWVLKTTDKEESKRNGDVLLSENGTSSWFRSAVRSLWPFRLSISLPFNLDEHNPSGSVSSKPEVNARDQEKKLPLLRLREYDLREHGIDLVVDFRWRRSHSL